MKLKLGVRWRAHPSRRSSGTSFLRAAPEIQERVEVRERVVANGVAAAAYPVLGSALRTSCVGSAAFESGPDARLRGFAGAVSP